MLKLVLFIHHQSGLEGGRLCDTIRRDFSGIPQECHKSFDSFQERLKHPVPYGSQVLYVVFADTISRLDRLCSLQEYFEDKRLILILPDNQTSTLSTGLQLRPRFLTSITDCMEDLTAVIHKMAGASLPENAGASGE